MPAPPLAPDTSRDSEFVDSLRAPRAGTVGALHARPGDPVAAQQCLVELQP